VGTYEAGGPRGPGYANSTEPPAREVIINAGRIDHTSTRALELRAQTTARLNDLEIRDTGRDEAGQATSLCDAVQLVGARGVHFHHVWIGFHDWSDHNCAAISSTNETVGGKTYVSQGHTVDAGPKGGLVIEGYRYGLYEGPGVGPSRLEDTRTIMVQVPAHTTNPHSGLTNLAP
jgi:hypothetical protein